MRISGGILRGRNVLVPHESIRPTQDKIRAAIFSVINRGIEKSRFLDLYAGTGAVGLEAISRGAEYVCWVEANPKVLRVLQRNVDGLCPNFTERIRIVRGDAEVFLDRPWIEEPFHFIFADPPYETSHQGRWLRKALQQLETNPILAPGGLLILEERFGDGSGIGGNWRAVWDRTYGETRVRFLERAA